MNLKIDIEIILKQRFRYEKSNPHYIQSLGLKVNTYDPRFSPYNCMHENNIFIAKNGMRLLTSLSAPLGKISYQAVVLPTPDVMGQTIYFDFVDDVDRRIYVRRLYHCIMEWCNTWNGFKGDGETKMCVDGNRWIFGYDDVCTITEQEDDTFLEYLAKLEDHNNYLVP